MYEFILMDIDNTILDFSAAETRAIKSTFSRFNVKYNDDLIKQFKSINSKLWQEYELGNISKERLMEKRFTDLFMKIPNYVPTSSSKEINIFYLNELTLGSELMPNAIETLQKLSRTSKIYPVTNGVYNTQMKRINGANIKQYFQDIFISERIGIQKPEAGFFDFVFQRLGNPSKNKVLLVGDSLSADIIGGIRYGLDTCWYNPKKEEGTLHPTFEITDLLQLLIINNVD